ncbi:MAG: flagellar motor protein MotB [bacterium]|jgi:chemotaxis protein MotB
MAGRKKAGEHGGGHERWLITYADMITLLMVMFVVFFAMAQVDLKKFAAAAKSLREGFGASKPVSTVGAADKIPVFDTPGGETVLEGAGGEGGITPVDIFEFGRLGSEIEEEIKGKLREAGLEASNVQVDYNERGIVITISPDNILFDSGKASLRPEFVKILDTIGPKLKDLPNQIQVEGHTDSVPINTAQFPSNWELSAARASSVIRYFERAGWIKSDRLAASGYADSRPVDTNATPEGRARNRRVEIVILRSARSADSARLAREMGQ